MCTFSSTYTWIVASISQTDFQFDLLRCFCLSHHCSINRTCYCHSLLCFPGSGAVGLGPVSEVIAWILFWPPLASSSLREQFAFPATEFSSGNASWRRTNKGMLHIWEEEGKELRFPLYFASSNPWLEIERSSLQGCEMCFMNFWKEGKGNWTLSEPSYCWQPCKKLLANCMGKHTVTACQEVKIKNNGSSNLLGFYSIRNISQQDTLLIWRRIFSSISALLPSVRYYYTIISYI